MLDYGCEYNNSSSNYKILMDKYYKLFNNQIISGRYGKSNKLISEYMLNNWVQINFDSLLNYTEILSKLKYHNFPTTEYDLIIQTKFDDVANITKLLDYIKKNFILKKEENLDINSLTESNELNNFQQFNFRYIVSELKSNGFLLFEQYFKDIQTRYANSIPIDMVYKDLKITRYFITIISQKPNTNVNRYVNEILIKIRSYLLDLMDSHYNNIAYQKIKVRPTSEKYKNVDISNFRREISTFKSLKYNFSPEQVISSSSSSSSSSDNTNTKSNLLICCADKEIPSNLSPYLDMYKSYYKARFPDRVIEYDLINSTLIVKMKFNQIYFIHMALLQYIVLDVIMKMANISATNISDKLNIPLANLSDTFNSLLKIKIIKRINSNDDICFMLNNDFTFEKNKLSISGLVKKDSVEVVKQREFLHDRYMIVLANLLYWAKKTKYFAADIIDEALVHVVPFKILDEHISKAIEKAISDEYIKEIKVPSTNGDGTFQIMYNYIEE